jgi:hypothetical protein
MRNIVSHDYRRVRADIPIFFFERRTSDCLRGC